MQPDVAAALRTIESALADTEPAPYSIVLTRDDSSGRVHRRGRIDGVPGLMTYERCNLDSADAFSVIPDLSTISDDAALCGNCFPGGVDLDPGIGE